MRGKKTGLSSPVFGDESWPVVNDAKINGAKESVYAEVVPKIDAADVFVLDHLLGRAAHQDFAIV